MNAYEDSLCSCGCGYPSVVSQAPENEGRFVTDLPIRCHARTSMVVAQKARDDSEDTTREALLWETPRLATGDATSGRPAEPRPTPEGEQHPRL